VTRRKRVLLTGASGVIGTALRPALTQHDVVSLTHRAAVTGESVKGDLTRDWLGLTPAEYRDLASRVDTVVHCAAVTDFATPAEKVNVLNVQGTRRVAELAGDAGARLVHVSTAFVARSDLTRGARGAASRDAAARPEDYLDSKRAGEAALRATGVPFVVARPSVVIGESGTGEISQFQGLHNVVISVLRNKVPLVPFAPDSLVDMVPQDLVVGFLRALVDSEVSTGEYWITAGPRALKAERMLDLTLEFCEYLGLDVCRPRLVPPEMVDRLIRPVFIDPLPARQRRQFDDLMCMAALFAGADPFPTSLGGTLGESVALPSPEWFESAFLASVCYLAHAQGIVRRATRAAA